MAEVLTIKEARARVDGRRHDPDLVSRLFALLQRSRQLEDYWRQRAARAEGKRRVVAGIQ